jgi:hypothetical protein
MPPDTTTHPPSPLCRVLAVAVGLFATWQLIYLPAANLIDLIPRRPNSPDLEPVGDQYQVKGAFTSIEPLQRSAEYTGDVLDFWSEVTAQEQGWALFAPGMPPYSVFPAVELHFADGTSDTALSQFEPLDKQHPRFRTPLVNNRLFNYEAQLIYPVQYSPPEEIAERFMKPEEFATVSEMYRELPNIVRAWRGPYRAWIAWRTKQYLAAHPERGTPTVVILKHRYILTPMPGTPAQWTQPAVERPFARWHPATDLFEAYDAINRRFVSVEAKP